MDHKAGDKLFLWLAALLLTLFGIGLALFPCPVYSERENRMLATFPTPQPSTLLDGSFTGALETYAAERIPAKELLRSLHATTELLLWKREANGVILGKGGTLLRRIPTDERVFAQNISSLQKLGEALEVPLHVCVAPRRIDAREAELPHCYARSAEQALWDALPEGTLTLPDCNAPGDWFCTDHHWTMQGAYVAYTKLGKALGYTPLPTDAFYEETVSERFYGTSHAAAGIPFIPPDRITLRLRGDEGEYRVKRDGEPATFHGFYDLSKLSVRDQYAVFLGGNCGVLEIDRGEGDTRPVLLVIKDSFANALLPYLARHYRILAVDPRYTASLSEYAEQAQAALLLCGMQTLTQGRFLPTHRK